MVPILLRRLILMRLLKQNLLVGAAVMVMDCRPGEPHKDDCDDDQGEDYEVAWAVAAQCSAPYAA
jgi:hypothetical protein